MSVGVSQIATVSAGANQAICSTTSTLAISGNVSGVTSTGFWTSNGTGAYNPGAGFLNNTYFLSLTDIANGSVIFTLTSTNNGPCPSVIDTVMVSIIPLAQVNAGTDQLICESQGLVSLSGTVNPNNGSWTSTGTGNFSPSSFSLTPTYSITANDIAAGFVTFTLTSTGNGPCPAVRDSVKVNIRKAGFCKCRSQRAIVFNKPKRFAYRKRECWNSKRLMDKHGNGKFSSVSNIT
ncbi:MAG: hypothetical protein IPG08_07935 [Sphingobacteriaceae bacterium]|nr:hypothetical protein [Sphingobacteriaceae bacterium]